MLKKLDEILLSQDVVADFYRSYNNPEFKAWLTSVLPEVEACKNQKQDNPWHIYDCLDHILHSVEEINKQTKNLPFNTQRKLAYTMFLHDMGKPEKYIRRYSKLYKREVDSFYNHNLASVDIAKRVLENDFGFDVDQSKEIQALVENHDIFMFLTLEDDHNPYHRVLTKSYIRQQESELGKVGDGKQLLEELIMVGRADNKAQNPEMTGESLHLLDVMEKMQTKIHTPKPQEQ